MFVNRYLPYNTTNGGPLPRKYKQIPLYIYYTFLRNKYIKNLLLILATRTPARFVIKIKSSETERSIGFDCPYFFFVSTIWSDCRTYYDRTQSTDWVQLRSIDYAGVQRRTHLFTV